MAQERDGARWFPEQRRVYLQGIGQVRVNVHRPVQGRVKTIQIKRQGRHWLLVLSCDDVPTNRLPATGDRPVSTLGLLASPPQATANISTIPAGHRAAADRFTVVAASVAARQTSIEEPRLASGTRWLRDTARSPMLGMELYDVMRTTGCCPPIHRRPAARRGARAHPRQRPLRAHRRQPPGHPCHRGPRRGDPSGTGRPQRDGCAPLHGASQERRIPVEPDASP